MDTPQEQLIGFLRTHGPAMPSQAAKHLRTEILLASAMLSEAVTQGKVIVSSLKIGGSPLYYLPGQESGLERFAAGNLNPKDVAVLQKLKQQKVLREAQLDLLEKVSIRSLKDFAVPLQVTVRGRGELFWKWRLSTGQEVHDSISTLLSPEETQASEPAERTAAHPAGQPAPAAAGSSAEWKAVSGSSADGERSRASAEWKAVSGSSADGERSRAAAEWKAESDETPALPKKRRAVQRNDDFFPSVEQMLRKLSISIEQKETIRRNKELNFLLKVPSAVGVISYFCKAKNKNRCDEKDLSAAYMQAQMKKLPLFLLYTGELTKKAQEMLESGALKNVTVRKVG